MNAFDIPLSPAINLHVKGRISASDAERQQHTAQAILQRLHDRPGQILADEVGMGKTFVALAVAISVVLSSPRKPQVVVMVPSSVLDKWERDFHTFVQHCLGDASHLRCSKATRPGQLLRQLEGRNRHRRHVIFMAHGAMNRRLRDPWIKLLLLQQAVKNRRGAAELRSQIARFAGSLLNMQWVDKRAPELWDEILDSKPSEWLSVLRVHGIGTDRNELPEDADNPVPQTLTKTLDRLNLTPLFELLRDELPKRRSPYLSVRLKHFRREMDEALGDIWETALAELSLRRPLIIVDEAHHLKNAHTRLASLFHSPEAEEEYLAVTRGALAGRFERMLFLTATPFQLGHHELCNVLERFGGIAWKGAKAPAGGQTRMQEEIEALRERLDASQRAAMELDHTWGRLTHEDMVVDGKSFKNPDEWWSAMLDASKLTPTANAVRRRFPEAQRSIRAAEEALQRWVIRHTRPKHLSDERPDCPRRVRHTGLAVREPTLENQDRGLPVHGDAALPFLLSARLVATTPESRPVFSEGLASSYEAFLHTRTLGEGTASSESTAVVDEEESLEPVHLAPRSRWYLQAISRSLNAQNGTQSPHPKVQATVERVMDLWTRGEKVLLFCHYLATGDVLRHELATRMRHAVTQRASEALKCPIDEAPQMLERLSDNRFAENAPVTRAVYRQISMLLDAYPELHSHRENLQEIARRFVRRPAFLVRYFDLTERNFGATTVENAFRAQAPGSRLSIRQVFEDFFEFLSNRCGETERSLYISAVENIQTGDIRVAERDETAQITANVRLINGGTDPDTRARLLLAFNTPFFPEVLVTTSVMAEGVDLHLNCRHVIHHDLSWNPSTLEQRTGRVDRIGAKAERAGYPIEVDMPFVAATQDEKMYRVVTDREQWFDIVMGGETMLKLDARTTDCLAERIPLPQKVKDGLTLSLSTNPKA